MRMSSSVLAGLVLIGFMAAPVVAQSAKSSIEAASAAFEEAYNSGDAAALAALYTEDAVLLPPDVVRMDGRHAVQNFMQGAMDSGPGPLEDLRLETLEVEDSGDLASEVGKFTVLGQDGAPAGTGKYIVVWKKGSDGTWRLHRHIWNSDPPLQQ